MIGADFSASLRGRLPVRSRGFTAIEMLVVTALFALGSLIVAATYINLTRIHRRVANDEYLNEELRFATEFLVRYARQNPVSYPILPATLTSPSSTLALDTSSSTVKIKTFASSTSPCNGSACLALSTNNGSTWTAITSKKISIDKFQVYLTPTASPFQTTGIGTYNNNNQPRITFIIKASYLATSTLEVAQAQVQTTVDSRVYSR
jgi:prepilin-type N-terminal cleavage/methylation domain-containing protein